ncbi:MAG: hypothetical protein RL518_2373 [Pseudomonadota bacterium]|jgi:dihydrofolate reductase
MSLPITLYYTTSLDGFIADAENNTPWSKTSWEAYLSFCAQVKNIIMGRQTYELFISDQTTGSVSFENLLVVSSTLRCPLHGFIPADSPADAVSKLVNRGASQAVIMGGSHVATSFLEAGLISEIRIDVEPIILGAGTRMFLPGTSATHLKLLSSESDSHGRTTLRYKV